MFVCCMFASVTHAWFLSLQQQYCGVLHVKVHQARNLDAKDVHGTSHTPLPTTRTNQIVYSVQPKLQRSVCAA